MAAVDAPARICGHCGRRWGAKFEESLGKVQPHEGRCDLCGVSTLVVAIDDIGGLKEEAGGGD